jgi:hypothetical protein
MSHLILGKPDITQGQNARDNLQNFFLFILGDFDNIESLRDDFEIVDVV